MEANYFQSWLWPSGYTDNTGATGSYAMWVDGSSPYPCDVSITTDSIDVSTLTSPSLEFYWFKNNTSASYVGNNTLTVQFEILVARLTKML